MDTSRFKKQQDDKKPVDWSSATAAPLDVQEQLRQQRIKHAGRYVPPSDDRPQQVNQTAADKSDAKKKPSKPGEASDANIAINISLPEWHLPRFTKTRAYLSRQWHRRWPQFLSILRRFTIKQITGLAVCILLVGLLIFGLTVRKHPSPKQPATKTSAATTQKSTGTGGKTPPPFTPVVPSTKKELTSPDGVHSRYDPAKGNYSYYDTINGKSFIVSQQQLASASVAQQTAATAAKSLKTTIELKTGWGTAYGLKSAKYDSQTFVFSVHSQLMFIQASFSLSNDQWTSYINSLQ